MDLTIEPPYLIVKPFVSEEESYRAASEDSDWKYPDGRLVMHSPASDRHEDLLRFLLTLLSAYLDARRAGVVRGSRYPMRLDPRWSPEPDLLVVREGRRHLLGPNPARRDALRRGLHRAARLGRTRGVRGPRGILDRCRAALASGAAVHHGLPAGDPRRLLTVSRVSPGTSPDF